MKIFLGEAFQASDDLGSQSLRHEPEKENGGSKSGDGCVRNEVTGDG
jgi:hypothetical protein